MDISHIREFLVLAECLSYTRAAEALHVSQPALSRHVQAMEQELGVTLFERSKREVSLTPAGVMAVEELEPIANRYDALAAKLSAMADDYDGVLCLEMLYYGAGSRYGFKLVETFRNQHPRVKLVLTSGQPHKIADDLSLFKIDAGITITSPFQRMDPNARCIVMGRQELYAIVSRKHPWAGLAKVEASAFADVPLILQDEEPTHTAHILGILEHNGVTVGTTVHTHNIDTLAMTLQDGKSAFIGSKLLENVSSEDLAFIPIQGEGFRLDFSLIVRSEDDNPNVKRLISCVQEMS